MKTKTVIMNEALYVRMSECMARTKIFNASEFIRLALESAIERVEKKFQITPATPGPDEITPSRPS